MFRSLVRSAVVLPTLLMVPGALDAQKPAPAATPQVPLQADRQYAGPTTLWAAAAGIAFSIPQGIGGAWENRIQAFVLRPATEPDIALGVFGYSAGSVEEIAEVVMEALATLGITVSERGAPVTEGSTVSALYDARSASGTGLVSVSVRTGSHQNILAAVAIGPAERQNRLRELATAVVRGATFTTPGAAQWAAALGGSRLVKIGTASNYSPGGAGDAGYASKSEERYDFCSDGSYGYYLHSESYLSVEGAGGMSSTREDGHQGRWRLIADLVGTAHVVLAVNDGRTLEFRAREHQAGVVLEDDLFRVERGQACP